MPPGPFTAHRTPTRSSAPVTPADMIRAVVRDEEVHTRELPELVRPPRAEILNEAHSQPDWVRAFLVMLTHGMGLHECAHELNQTPERLLAIYNSPGFKGMLQERVARGGQINPVAIQGAAVDAFLMCHSMVLSPTTPAATKLKAAEVIMNRAWGKVPERVILPDKDLPSDPMEAGRALQDQILQVVTADPVLRETIKNVLNNGH